MNAKKCKAIRRNVRAQLAESNLPAIDYQPIKRRTRDLGVGGQRTTVCDPIKLSPDCYRFYFKSFKRSADPRWMKKVS